MQYKKVTIQGIDYINACGDYFKVVKVAATVDEANEYMEKNENCGVIDQNDDETEIFICEIVETKVRK
jgi:hypothetical protein